MSFGDINPALAGRDEQKRVFDAMAYVRRLSEAQNVGLLFIYHPKCHACHEMAPVIQLFARSHRNVWTQLVNLDDPAQFDINHPVRWGPNGRYGVRLGEVEGTPTFVMATPNRKLAQRAGTFIGRPERQLMILEAWAGSTL